MSSIFKVDYAASAPHWVRQQQTTQGLFHQGSDTHPYNIDKQPVEKNLARVALVQQ